MIELINSGGQTGVDRAALDFGLKHGFRLGGWCPKGRVAEDGIINEKYPLRETATPEYEERTLKNMVDSDGTLIISQGIPTGGTLFAIEQAYERFLPFYLLNIKRGIYLDDFVKWINANRVRTINVAGPRESTQPGIYDTASDVLEQLFKAAGVID